MNLTYTEKSRELEVFAQCDILVVGGGSAGHSAAVAAARAGAENIIILERQGFMGGDVTGGYVIMVPCLSWKSKSFVRGLQEEWFTRLEKIPGAVFGPSLDEIGLEDELHIQKWLPVWDCTSRTPDRPSHVRRSVWYEPNQLKIEMDKMLLEQKDRIRVCYYSLGCTPIMEGDTVRGVVFESKEGRKAIYAKVVIDATGDGDIFCQTGTDCHDKTDPTTRSSKTALVYRLGGCDFMGMMKWQKENPKAYKELEAGMAAITGYRMMPINSNANDIIWINNWQNEDCITVEGLTRTEMSVRDTIREEIAFLKKYCPEGFKDAFLYDIAPTTGLRGSRRLQGEYIMTANDFAFHREFDDVIAWHSTICQINDCAPVEIPYRAILPKVTENLLCPGRHLSADAVAIDWLNLIPQCVGTGQAAGVAAAVAVMEETTTHGVNIRRVQDILVAQDVPLPRHPGTDPSYTELCEANDYGLYTELARQAREEHEKLNAYRQW